MIKNNCKKNKGREHVVTPGDAQGIHISMALITVLKQSCYSFDKYYNSPVETITKCIW